MKSIHLIVGCHAHQPIGNFGFVFEEAYEKSYLPFVDTLERYPAVRVTLHYTGPLWDWFLEHHPEYIQQLRRLVERGQVEIMGGAYYEPLLCAIPERDAKAQIRRMQAWCEEHLGQTPRGMWLAERVWEPHMARILAESGVEYAALDDSHFVVSGLDRKDLFGYYMTEDEGQALKVFPIHERLRYTIPFRPVEETIAFLREHATEDGRRCAVFHDDSEKFGVWPGTYKSVYTDGWLERFFEAVTENSDWLKSVTYSEFVDQVPALGRTYITCASYSEMMGWAMPPLLQRRLHDIEHELAEDPAKQERYGLFIRGGFWRNFLAKYAESNNLQKRMLASSRRLEALRASHPGAPELERAELLVHQGQCNCAYWHGVFGGLYLNHLRTAIYEQCIAADVVMDALDPVPAGVPRVVRTDFDGDGQAELLIENPVCTLIVAPADGGTLFEWDYKPRPFNLLNVLTRRLEAYHDKLQDAEQVHADGHEGATSIHDILHAKEPGLQALLNYDNHRRVSLRDRCFAPGTPVEMLWRDKYAELSTLPGAAYEAHLEEGEVRLRAESVIAGPVEGCVGVEKVLRLAPDASSLHIAYTIANTGDHAVNFQFGMDWAVNFLAGNAHDRYYESADVALGKPVLSERASHAGMSHIALCDEYTNLRFDLRFSAPATVHRFPLETVSQSEGGQERVYQGSVVLPSWLVQLEPGAAFRVAITAECSPLGIA